jgi:hypothetical protein
MLGAQYQIIELSEVQWGKTLSATVRDESNSPMGKALVQEFSPDWKTVLRTSVTGPDGRFSLPPVKAEKIYYLQISAPGFDPLRLRMRVDPKGGVHLIIKMHVAT